MLFSSLFNWKLFLIPFITVVNFLLFILSVYYLKKCINPFIKSDFYSSIVIKNLKKSGGIFVFIGVSTIFFRFISVVYIINSVPMQGLSWFSFIAFISSIDISTIFLIIIGLFFLLFSNAFENAKSLKQENDLTI